jgi:competence protein ComFC
VVEYSVKRMSVEIHPKELKGDWEAGYALDAQTLESTYVGDNEFGHRMFDTKRSALGELLYQLKYHNDSAAIAPIVETVAEFLKTSKASFEVIIPVPPSNPSRRSQPVIEIAKSLSSTMNIPLCEKCVLKVKSTPQLKNVYDLSERERVLTDAFAVNTKETSGKRVLLFDDLYRSGATMNAVARILRSSGQARAVFVLALTYTRSLR